jgi:hypothetical protein
VADDLAEAERILRRIAELDRWEGVGAGLARPLIAEYDRRAEETDRLRSGCDLAHAALVAEEAEHENFREAIANRDSAINRLLGVVAAVRKLADDLDGDDYAAGIALGSIRASDITAMIRAVLDGSADRATVGDAKGNAKADGSADTPEPPYAAEAARSVLSDQEAQPNA